MLATMDNLQYKEHKLAEKAQRILELRSELKQWKAREKEHRQQKPACNKNMISYEESLEFGEEMDEYEKELRNIELNKLKVERQLSALELQAQKLLPVSGINIEVAQYDEDGFPKQSYCVRQSKNGEQSNTEGHIEIEPCKN
jgi:hypothetical protein